MVGLSALLNRLWTRRTEPRIMPAVDPRTKALWTVEDLARHWYLTRQAVAGRISRGTLIPHYVVRTGPRRVMYLFDPDRLPPRD
jgi:hypothetical protein